MITFKFKFFPFCSCNFNLSPSMLVEDSASEVASSDAIDSCLDSRSAISSRSDDSVSFLILISSLQLKLMILAILHVTRQYTSQQPIKHRYHDLTITILHFTQFLCAYTRSVYML
eukprot:1394810-Amorphochlora_amoeboformis.AAC.1